MSLYLTTTLCNRDIPGKTQQRAYASIVLARTHEEAIGKSHAAAMKRFPSDAGWGAPLLVANEIDLQTLKELLDQALEQVNPGKALANEPTQKP